MGTDEPEQLQVAIAWTGVDDTEIQFANQFIVQHEPGEFVLSIGQMTGPALIGTPKEVREQASQRGTGAGESD